MKGVTGGGMVGRPCSGAVWLYLGSDTKIFFLVVDVNGDTAVWVATATSRLKKS